MLVAVLAMGFSVKAAFAGTIVNGSFELGVNPGSFHPEDPGSGAITGWDILGPIGSVGAVDYIGDYWVGSSPLGGRSVDLNGFGVQGGVAQIYTTVPGATYVIRFDLSGNPDSLPDANLWSPSAKVVQVSVNAAGATAIQYTYDTSIKGNTKS